MLRERTGKMKTGLKVLFLWLLTTRLCSATAPPKPWMTERTRTKTLHLVCEPPSEGALWEEVTDLRVFRQRGQTTNMSVANMTTAMARFNHPPALAQELPPLTQASFSGSFETKDPSLAVLVPLEDAHKAETFYCDIYKTDAGADTYSVLSSKLATNSEQARPSARGPRFQIIEAHRVQITWQQMKDFQFEYAHFERVPIDFYARQTRAAQTLFVTDGRQNMTFPSEGFLAAKLDKGGNPNYTFTALFREDMCDPDCVYTCRVAHPFCFGQDEKDCLCLVPSSVTLESPCHAPNCEVTTCIIVASVVCTLLGLVCIVMVLLYVLKRRENEKLKDDLKGPRDVLLHERQRAENPRGVVRNGDNEHVNRNSAPTGNEGRDDRAGHQNLDAVGVQIKEEEEKTRFLPSQ